MSPLRWVDRWLWSMQWSSVADCLLLVMTGLIYRDAMHSPAQADPNVTASTDTVRTLLAPLWSLNETTKTLFFGCIIVVPQLLMLQYRRRRCLRSPRRLSKFQVIGLMMFISGYALRMWAKVVLGRFFTYEISTPDTDTLVTSGPYAVLVHPGYAGAIIYGIGFNIVAGARFPTALFLLMYFTALFVRIRVREEEFVLREHFGDAFDVYAAERWRLVPLLY